MSLHVRPARSHERSLIERMLEPYLRGYGAPPGFIYPHLDSYWRDANRYPYVVACGDTPVGFAFVQRTSDEPSFELVEFYIAEEFRRRDYGRRAAESIFGLHPGTWFVAVRADNPTGCAFWKTVLATRRFTTTETTTPPGTMYTLVAAAGNGATSEPSAVA